MVQRVDLWRRQRTRQLVQGFLVTVLVITVGALALWGIPVLLVQHPHTTSAARHKAVADARTATLAFLALVGASTSVVLAFWSYRLNHAGQITDRFAKAVDQLGEASPDACIGGIHSLDRIMSDSVRDENAVVDVLSAFVRRVAKRTSDESPPWSEAEAERDKDKPSLRVQAALNALGQRRSRESDEETVPDTVVTDLRDTDLRGARMHHRKNFAGAVFRRSFLYKAHLEKSVFTGAHFNHADLREADLKKADLRKANFRKADLRGAVFTDADAAGANFTLAKVNRGALSESQLSVAQGADMIIWFNV
ncbi:pentapeptide repeat-containing protein [Streptomyces geranii]|uniref:pentapeptide repeat-containing protein n=1 Tax=Streptomyces geranii TaxID=2058923 RepID=UPI000D03B35C|nr:pentapeptide repeat-containing protein [Streptomyces geranii]